MLNKIFFSVFLLLLCNLASAQKVGVVLSGGGAKGLAHIGVLKALEENEIPIDYIVGTSMGGIVGGCYAMGMSPDEIEYIILSDEFRHWITGVPAEDQNAYFHAEEPDPHFIKLNLSLDSTLSVKFNTTIASDVLLNFALAEKMAQSAPLSSNNFDSLFVPFRVVASDIFTQQQVIISQGSLSEALRVTQTVPFFYNPIRFEGRYLFDGGIYNNFPVDIAESVFQPDLIIGSNVSSKVFSEYPYKKDDDLINYSLLFMLLDKSDPGDLAETGVYIQPDLHDYSAFDFSEAKSLIDSGYAQTMSQMEEIKSKIAVRRTCEEVAQRRDYFKRNVKPLAFERLEFEGFNSKQRAYIQKIFKVKPESNNPFYIDKVRKGYNRLVSEQYFSSIYPNILYDSASQQFIFKLLKRKQKNFQVSLGGGIATRNVSGIFLGADYYHFNRALTHAFVGFNAGTFYKSATARLRIDYPSWSQTSIEPKLSFNNFDFLESEDLLRKVSPTVLKRFDRNVSITIGKPVSFSYKGSLELMGINSSDRYGNSNGFTSADTLDKLRLNGFKGTLKLETNSLNDKMYPSSGKMISFSASYFNVVERYKPGTTSFSQISTRTAYQWFRATASVDQYFYKGWYHPGYSLQAVISNQPVMANYRGTVINAPGFSPLQDSRTLILENFRAFNYVAGGLKNVFSLAPKLDFRIEGYLFKPIEYLKEEANQETSVTRDLKTIFFAASTGFVLRSPVGPIALTVNYYDDKENRLGIMLHVGYLLFPSHSIGN